MPFTLNISGYKSSSSVFQFLVYYKTSEQAEWTYVGTGQDPFRNFYSWYQNSEMWLRIVTDWDKSNYCLQQKKNSEWVEPTLMMDDAPMKLGTEYERVEWDADHVIFRILPKDYGESKAIQISIPYSMCSRVDFDSAHAFFDGPPWSPEANKSTTIKLRPVAPASFVKTEEPTITFSAPTGKETATSAWNENDNGWDLTINPTTSSQTLIEYELEASMATEKYGAFGDLGKSLSVTPVSTDTVIAVLARGKTDMNAVTFADLSAYLGDRPINPSDACDMCAYALYATAGVNNVVWCGGADLAACIKTFQDYMTRTPQVSCIVIDGGFTTTKEDAATILAGIKKID